MGAGGSCKGEFFEKSLKKVAKKDEKNLVVQKKAVPLQSRSENERVF